jgi:hypothetical protein
LESANHQLVSGRLRIVWNALAPQGDALGRRQADNEGMTNSLRRPASTLTTFDLDRIRNGCSHVLVPDQPAAGGYRYFDLGGGATPFYLRRLSAGPILGSVTLAAPIELTSGDEAERGARALAKVGVSIGMANIPWNRLFDQDLCGGVWADLIRQALEAISELETLERDECPICSAGD